MKPAREAVKTRATAIISMPKAHSAFRKPPFADSIKAKQKGRERTIANAMSFGLE